MNTYFIVEDINPSKIQKNIILDILNCKETDALFIELMNNLKTLKVHVADFKTQSEKVPSKQQEELDIVAGQARRLLESLQNLDHHKEVIDQLYRYNHLTEFGTTSNVSMLSQLSCITESLEEAYKEVIPKRAKKPLITVTIKVLIPLLKKHGFPVGKTNVRFNDLLNEVLQLLDIDPVDNYERMIRDVTNELKGT